jgi:hypothetical protein
MMKKLWLWLDQNHAKEDGIHRMMDKAGMKHKEFGQPCELTDYLVEHKKQLDNFGLIMEVRFAANAWITSPKRWNGTEDKSIRTEMGYDTGLAYYENMVIGQQPEPIWQPLPPTYFLTSLQPKSRYVDLESRLMSIRNLWAIHNRVEPEDALVKYIRKQDIKDCDFNLAAY